MVFNIKGNKVRLVVKIDYGWGQIYICWFGTHAEYDKIDGGNSGERWLSQFIMTMTSRSR